MTSSQDTPAEDEAPRPWKKVRRVPRFLVLGLGVGYGLLALGAALFSERLIFQPHPSSCDSPPWLRTAQMDEEDSLALLYLPNPKAQWTVLYSHGNAQDLGDVKGYLEIMRDHGFAVLSYDCRGYGKSSGAPSVDAARQDAESAFDYLVEGAGHNDLFLVGGPAYWSAVTGFVDALRQTSPPDGE